MNLSDDQITEIFFELDDLGQVTLLKIEIPSFEIDVNIHPTKREVRFNNAKGIFEVIKEAIADSLGPVGAFAIHTLLSVVPIGNVPVKLGSSVSPPV